MTGADEGRARGRETGTVGEVVGGRYRIVGLLGIGAMGCIYRAESVEGGDEVAIKLLHPELGSSAEICRRFEREAMATARLEGPYFPRVFDFGALADGRLYLAMERLRGLDAGAFVEKCGRVEPPRAVEIAAQALAGLEIAHGAGVLHRDLKPENIFLARDGSDRERVVLLDFGLAKLIGDLGLGQEALTRAGYAMGTPTYMAPEWVTRQSYDERGDLYALSVILYELATGEPPFRADEGPRVLRMHAEDDVPPMAERAAELASYPGFEALVRWGLEKWPERRVPDAATYRQRLDILQSEPEASARRVAPERAGADAAPPRKPASQGGTAPLPGLAPGASDSSAQTAPSGDPGSASAPTPHTAPEAASAPAPASTSEATPDSSPEATPDSTIHGPPPARSPSPQPPAPSQTPSAEESPHGSPAPPHPDAAADPGATSPPRGPAHPAPPEAAPSAAGLPPSPSAPQLPPAGRSGRRVTRGQLGAAGFALALLAAIAAAVALSREEAPHRLASVVDEIGEEFEVGGFASLDEGHAGGECKAGAIHGIPTVLCAYESRSAAAEAAENIEIRGRIRSEEEFVLALRPAPAVDPEGERADAIAKAFEAAASASGAASE